jgi:hypothetical protein
VGPATIPSASTPLTLPPADELEARLRAARQEAVLVKRLLRIRRDLDAAEQARALRLVSAAPRES